MFYSVWQSVSERFFYGNHHHSFSKAIDTFTGTERVGHLSGGDLLKELYNFCSFFTHSSVRLA